jgi:hypothetical protein
MTRRERIRYEMLLRVRDFGKTHRELFPESSHGGKAFATVAGVVDGIEAHAQTKLLAAKNGMNAKKVARETMRQRMRVIARTARGVLHLAPSGNRKFVMPLYRSDVALLTAARAFVREGEAVLEKLLELDMPRHCIEELRAAANAFEAAMQGRRAGRSGVAASQAGISTAIARGAHAVRTLDVVVLNVLENDAVTLAAWRRDRRVVDRVSKKGPNHEPPVVTDDSPTEPPIVPAPLAEVSIEPLQKAS